MAHDWGEPENARDNELWAASCSNCSSQAGLSLALTDFLHFWICKLWVGKYSHLLLPRDEASEALL